MFRLIKKTNIIQSRQIINIQRFNYATEWKEDWIVIRDTEKNIEQLKEELKTTNKQIEELNKKMKETHSYMTFIFNLSLHDYYMTSPTFHTGASVEKTKGLDKMENSDHINRYFRNYLNDVDKMLVELNRLLIDKDIK